MPPRTSLLSLALLAPSAAAALWLHGWASVAALLGVLALWLAVVRMLARTWSYRRVASPIPPRSLRSWTWDCEVCGRTRADADVAVATSSVDFPSGGAVTRNVVHCADSESCRRAAEARAWEWVEQIGRKLAEGARG